MSVQVGGATITVGQCQHRERFKIESALVITRMGESRIVTHHAISGGKRLELGPGTPVDKSSAMVLLESIRDADTERDGWVHPSVLFKTDSTIAWHVPAAVRGLYYKHGKAHAMRVPWPALVFVARRGGELQLFAVAGDSRPTPATRLYHAPLANVNAHGVMCWGSAERPRFGVSGIPDYETAVFRTWFTHPNHDRAIAGGKRTKGGDYIFDFYRRLRTAKAKAFPAKALAPTKLTLENVCAS